MNWEYFYDYEGVPLIRLYRILGQLRSSASALRSRESFFLYQQSLQGTNIIAYQRHAPATATTAEQYAMVLVNFSANAGTITVPFPKAGAWIEKVDADVNPTTVAIVSDGDLQTLTVPSWYGHIYLLG